MALRRSDGLLPDGSVLLSEDEAVIHQWKRVTSWEPAGDVWPLKYGVPISAVSSSLTALYINGFYRKMLKLGSHGKFASYLPTVIFPAIASSLFHQQKVLSDVLILRSECPVCVQIRSSAIQAFCGALYPAVLAPLAGFMLATRHYTYDIPSATKAPKEAFQLWLRLTRRIQGFLMAAVCGQALVGAGLAFLQVKSIITVNEKMLAAEESGVFMGKNHIDNKQLGAALKFH